MVLECFTGQMYGRDIWVMLSLLIMVLIISLAYMVSRILHRIEWEAWARNESYQVIVSAVIASSMIFIADISCVVSTDLAGGDAFDIAEQFLTSNYHEGISIIYSLYGIVAQLDFMANFQIASATNPMFIKPMFPGLSAIAQHIRSVIAIIALLSGNLMVQKIGLEIIEQIAFNILLPLGLVMRVFPWTRDAGSFVIAVAFGFYIVFPLTYVMASEVMDALALDDEGNWTSFVGLPGFPLPGPGAFFLINLFFGPLTTLFYDIRNLDIILAATFFPVLSITITITFIKALTKAIVHHTG
ncbi:MAG: hypothetical protein ABIG39_02110 [Candidatus Micrarchaeota archaeon]